MRAAPLVYSYLNMTMNVKKTKELAGKINIVANAIFVLTALIILAAIIFWVVK
jgi:hypothetical protein